MAGNASAVVGDMNLAADLSSPGHYDGPATLATLPTELVLKAMESMTPKDLSNFAVANKRLFVLRLPELETMLFFYTANDLDFLPRRMLHARTIVFNPERENGSKINFLHTSVAFNDGKLICPERFEFGMADILALWKLVKVIDWWVDIYPSLRWRDHPEDRRCLRASEEARLRKAVARWWLFSHYFHGIHWRDCNAPKKWQDDHRLHHLRILPTHEICELEDLWGVMYDTTSKDLCSSPERVRDGNWSGVELVPWGLDEGRHSDIVNTYLKLDPEQLQYFLRLYHRRKKTDIIRAVSSSVRKFTLDRETLSLSISTVLQERMMLKPHGIYDIPRIGIIDDDRVSDKECELWTGDASSNGKAPLTQQQISAFPAEVTKRMAYGDDGSETTRPF
ncbi:Uu.00g063330.m01.CDS01 [Anthostomella pinea]|uniref:Uu.00g063330.m01.CDS01 n=1 Tax=Anthostomella pinea TaxID=933095 RepID=A0AAI8VUK7_9PEZI|nr:Uu.00g063330.m01.CDS01 [Anthostomella pinea]